MTLVEQKETLDAAGNIDDEIVNDDVKIAEILNRFFSNAVKDLKMSGFHKGSHEYFSSNFQSHIEVCKSS